MDRLEAEMREVKLVLKGFRATVTDHDRCLSRIESAA